ncbi:GlxA family transcriptional regulator [Streptomyces sp. NPDC015346]|uniref:GlxA family transcriptional regulator n=1 Tax=Streptomyces sp. NPDC015346 TaxID=3364954 RepID=UPI00370086E5
MTEQTTEHMTGHMIRSVVVLAFDGVRLLDVSAPLEVFTTAGSGYEVRVCTPDGRDVRTSAGLRIGADCAPEQVGGADTLIVPGAVDVDRFVTAPGMVALVAELAGRSRRVASVCTGAFALAAAGLLDGRRATTHWEHAAELARRHPEVEVTPDAIHVRDGEVFTSAGVTAGIDLCLALVEEDHGPAAARAVARDLVVFLQRPGGQSQFSAASRTPPTVHPVVRPLLDAVAADPGADHSGPALARRAGVSARHLARLFREQIGATPAAYVERVRVEAARLLLEGGASVTGAAARSGLGSDESLRRAFARHVGVTPSAYLARFRTSAGAAGAQAST